jgi:hypothetical protein
MEKNKKVRLGTIFYAILLAIIVLLVVFGIGIYGFGVNNQVTKKAVNIFPYPAIVIDGVHFISIRDLQENVSAVKRFYENQDFSKLGVKVDFDSEEGKNILKIKERDLMIKMIENKIIEIAANDNNIKLTAAMISDEIEKRRTQYGSADGLEKNLMKLYGWTIEDFKEKVVKPDMYKKIIAMDMKKTDQKWIEARKKIDKAKARLDSRDDFSSVAKDASEGDSAKNGGELGWFDYDQMLPEISSVAATLAIGGQSEVIESSLGYHIIRIEDRKSEDGIEKVKLSQIFVRAKTFSDWLLEKEKSVRIMVLLPGVKWNNDGGIDFISSDMRAFEEKLKKDTAFGMMSEQVLNN